MDFTMPINSIVLIIVYLDYLTVCILTQLILFHPNNLNTNYFLSYQAAKICRNPSSIDIGLIENSSSLAQNKLNYPHITTPRTIWVQNILPSPQQKTK